MRPELWQRVKERLHSALEEPGSSDDVLKKACAEDAELYQELRSLLEFSELAGDFIEEPAVDLLRGRVDGWIRDS